MPLLDRQRRGVVLGQIKIGQQVPIANKPGKFRPAKLDTFRLTSPDRNKIEAAAALYGGEVRPWKPSENAPGQWDVITTTDRLPVRVPPGHPITQDYALFDGRPVVRTRLCDGVTERMKGRPCVCPADLDERRLAAQAGQACKPTTQLAVILADLEGLGVWKLTSRGEYAADELAATAELLQQAEVSGVMLPATLRLEQRRGVGSGEVRQFAVPVLDVGASLAALESGTYQRAGIAGARQQALAAAPQQELEPPPAAPPAPMPPPPVGRPSTPQACADAAIATSDVGTVRYLAQGAKRAGWDAEYVDDGTGVLSPLENVLYERLEKLGGVDGP